jgi:hypothetical protein
MGVGGSVPCASPYLVAVISKNCISRRMLFGTWGGTASSASAVAVSSPAAGLRSVCILAHSGRLVRAIAIAVLGPATHTRRVKERAAASPAQKAPRKLSGDVRSTKVRCSVPGSAQWAGHRARASNWDPAGAPGGSGLVAGHSVFGWGLDPDSDQLSIYLAASR